MGSHKERRNPEGFPALVCYLAMAVRAVPSLERAISFAASQLGGEIGETLGRKLSDLNLGRKKSGAEVLEEVAKEWEGSCPELRHSLHLISSSTCERSESSRERSLSMSLSVVLRGTMERYREYASRIHHPILLVYTLGVLLPLVVSVMAPVFSTAGFGGVNLIVLFNCVLCPALVWWLSRRIIKGRPCAFEDMKIPLSPLTSRLVAAAVGVSSVPPLLALLLGFESELLLLAFLWSGAVFSAVLLYSISFQPYRAWQSGLRMEKELPQSLIQIGNRMLEGRPAEEAIARAAELYGGSELRAIFCRVVSKVRFGGAGLKVALFGEEGLLHSVPSSMVIGTMRAMVDIVEIGTRAGGEALLYISELIRKIEEVQSEMRRMMGEVVGSMRSVATVFAPMIAGVTASIFSALSRTEGFEFFGWTSLSSDVFAFGMGFYVLVLSAILTWLAVEMEFWNQLPPKLMAIALSGPVAILVFTVSFVLGNQFMGRLIG